MATRSGWTGGQYSTYRAVLALLAGPPLIAVAGETPLSLPAIALAGAALLATAALAAGWRDRWASLALAGLWLLSWSGSGGSLGSMAGTEAIGFASLLALHACMPAAPYGAWEARDRTDPAGDWRFPSWVGRGAWVVLAVYHALSVISGLRVRLSGGTPDDGGLLSVVTGLFQILFVLAAFHPPLRRSAWSAIMLWQIAWSAAFAETAPPGPVWLLHLLAFEPGWIPARSWLLAAPGSASSALRSTPARLFYDGDCGFCHRSVRLVLAEEGSTPEALRLRFAPLASPAFDALLERHAIDRDRLPDSIVLELEDGSLQTRSRAALEIASRLGGLWRAIAIALGWMPQSLLDLAYDGVARIRTRLFARPEQSCPLVTSTVRARFEL